MDLRQVIADLCSDEPTTSPWWVTCLVEQLPEDSALAGSVADASPRTGRGGNAPPSFRGWGTERHLLAAIFDAVQAQTIVLAKVNGAKNVQPADPWPRPGRRSGRGESMKGVVGAHRAMAERRRAMQKQKGVGADGKSS